MKAVFAFICLILCWGCTPAAALYQAELLQRCTLPGETIRREMPEPRRGYPYDYKVYLPPCFSAEAATRYPIVYLIPGRSSSPDAWFAAGLAELLDKLILEQKIPPFLLVITENIESDPRAESIHKELIPFIESQYPIIDDRLHRAVAGGSLGGIAAYRLAFTYPNQFSSAGIFGAGAISGEEVQIREWLDSMSEANPTRVFLGCGDQDIFMLDRARVMKSILDDAGIENELHIGQGGHNYAYWVSNFELYLKWLSREW